MGRALGVAAAHDFEVIMTKETVDKKVTGIE